MRYTQLLPVALLVIAACADPATSPKTDKLPSHPSMDAGNGAHFMSTSAAFSDASLVISFREAGLGNSPTATVSISVIAAGSATYACINGGGKHPNAANKENVNGPVGATGVFGISKNGSATGSLTLDPPPSTLVCPSGQTFVLAAVSFSNVLISDNTNSVLDVAVSGGPTFSKTFFNLN